MEQRTFRLRKRPAHHLLTVLGVAMLVTTSVAQRTTTNLQRQSVLDSRQLAAIACASRLPEGIKRSRQLDTVMVQLRQGKTKEALETWKGVITEIGTLNGKPLDPNALIQYVLRASYLEANEDLKSMADKVKYFNDLKKQLREEITSARSDVAGPQPWPMKRRVVVFRKTYVRGAEPVERKEDRVITKRELEAALSDYEKLLSAVGEGDQLANLDLQSALQRQQQTLQTMSQISKQLHDTAMAVIRKIGG